MKYKFYFHKISYDDYTVEADSKEEAKKKADQYLSSIQNDYYQGGDWYMDYEVTEL